MYTYKVVKEDWNGAQAKRSRRITRNKPLVVGGLYVHLGKGFPGAYRVLELLEKEENGYEEK